MREVASAPKEFLEALAKDPDVADWLISVTELQRTRGEYLEYAGQFFYWAEWTPQQLFALKREAVKAGEPRSEVEAKLKRYHDSLNYIGMAQLPASFALAEFNPSVTLLVASATVLSAKAAVQGYGTELRFY